MRLLSILILSLLVGSAEVVVGQRTPKRARSRRVTDTGSAAKPANLQSTDGPKSPSGKLVISGSHVGLLGILDIETDISVEGPLVIVVVGPTGPVPQREGDKTGVVMLPLTRKKNHSVQVKLAIGKNVIQVTDSVDRNETATLQWVGVETENGAASDMRSEAAVQDNEEPRVRSTSGRLSVLGLHTDEQATLDVAVGNLKGPFTIQVTDESKKVVLTKKKNLNRGETSFVETLPLKSGQYVVTIASEDSKEKAETVSLGPWTVKGPEVVEAEPPAAFYANDFKASDKGNLAATVTRVNGAAHLKVHVSDTLRGFKVRVVDADGTEVDSRTFPDLERGVNDWSLSVRAGNGENTVTVSALDGTESIQLTVPALALLKPADPAPTTEEAVEYDWGRVRGYFAGGMIFSKERDDFSHSDMFLDFTLDKNYIARPWLKIWPDSVDENGDVRHHYLFKDFNTFFNARLTSIPVAAKETESGTTDCNTPDCEAFITSRKAALMQAGIYLPMYWNFTTWYRRVPRLNRPARWEKNALFIAPLAKGGIMTVTGDRETAEAQQFGQDDVFNFYSFGAMLGHFRLHARRKRNAFGQYEFYKTGRPIYESNPNIAPELISWLTLSMGRWENFEIEVPTGEKDAMGNDIKVRQRPWRYEALGRLKIPETPFIIGFDGNFGKGPDDVRFIFGTRFDIGKIMRTLKLASAQDAVGQPQVPVTPPATPSP